MNIKFVAPLLVIAVFGTVSAFAYDHGPAPELPPVSGIFAGQTCAMSGCHTGNPLNAAGGSLTISGLPAGYESGQTYDLQVTVSRSTAVVYGFQMTAVDAATKQAGTFQSIDSRTSTPSTAGLMVVQHTQNGIRSTPRGVFSFKWTAPNTTSGPVRINVAGNAANGNGDNTGDFIYTTEVTVPPAASVPPVIPPVDYTTESFLTPDSGGVFLQSDGSNDLTVGYARIVPDVGKTTPNGVAIFGLRQNGILVTEAGVPSSTLIQTGRIYAEVEGAINTGVAIANPGGAPATVNFTLTDSSGTDVRTTSTTIPAGNQMAAFLDQVPFSAGSSFHGTVTISSSSPIAVIALRGFTNERSEFLITTLPVVDVSAAASTGFILPQYADGGGWTTEVILVNPGDTAIAGTVTFRNGQGSSANVVVNGQTASTIPYTVAPRSSTKLKTAGTATTTGSGSVQIVSASGPAAIPLVVFSFRSRGVTVAEAGVPAFDSNAAKLYVESSGTAGQIGAVQSGIAISSAAGAAVNLELFSLDGTPTGLTRTLQLPANGQTAQFLSELFPTLSTPFRGIMRLTSTGSNSSVVGLRGTTNERGDFLITTTPASNENVVATSEFAFPHIVNGGGYSTQFILLSGAAEGSSGTLRFFKQDGTGFELTLQ